MLSNSRVASDTAYAEQKGINFIYEGLSDGVIDVIGSMDDHPNMVAFYIDAKENGTDTQLAMHQGYVFDKWGAGPPRGLRGRGSARKKSRKNKHKASPTANIKKTPIRKKNPWNMFLKENKGKYSGKDWIKKAAADYRAQAQ